MATGRSRPGNKGSGAKKPPPPALRLTRFKVNPRLLMLAATNAAAKRHNAACQCEPVAE
jgi:hypothetical protein